MKKTISAITAVCMLIMSMGISVLAQDNSFMQVSTFEEFKAAIEDPAVDTIEMMDSIQVTQPLTLTKDVTIGTWQPEAFMVKAHDDGPMFRVVGDDITIRLVRNFEAQVVTSPGLDGAGAFISADVNHLTIKDAHLSGFDGMIYMEKGDVTLDNCLVYDNYADPNLYWGPVVYSENGDVTVKNSRIHDNTSSDAAGAIYAANGDVEIDNSTLENNRAYHYGGAVYVRNGHVTVINNSKIINNRATAGAGGIHVEYGTVIIDDTSSVTGNIGPGGDVVVDHVVEPSNFVQVSTFSEFKKAIENTAVDTIELMNHISVTEPLILTKSITIGTWQPEAYLMKEHNDGPMFQVEGGDITIRLVRNVEAQVLAFPGNNGGGAFISANVENLTVQDAHLSGFNTVIRMEAGNLTLDNCLCYDNHGSGNYSWGSVVSVDSGNVTVKNSNLHDNSASVGGAICVGGGDVIIDNSTLKNNTAEQQGGAVNVMSGYVTLKDGSVITENQAGQGAGGIHIEWGYIFYEGEESLLSGNIGPGGDVWIDNTI